MRAQKKQYQFQLQVRVKESPTVSSCLNLLLERPSEVFIEKIMRKESLTDGQHLYVDHTIIGKSIIQLINKITVVLKKLKYR